MKRSIIAAIAILSIVFLAQANEKDDNWEAKKQEHFVKMKEIKLQDYRERISILQDAATCTEKAQTHEAMKSCDDREQSAMEDHKQHMKARYESIKPR